MSWTDLRQALVPQGLAKSGVIAELPRLASTRSASTPRCSRSATRRYAGNLATVGPFAAARSSLAALRGVRTPVFMMQGRRDFAFGLDQAKRAYARSRGRSSSGSASTDTRPSSGVAADTPAMLAEGARWFDRFLRGDTAAPLGKPVAISPENWKGQPRRFAGLPKVVVRRPSAFEIHTIPAARAIAQSGRYSIPLPPRQRPMEISGHRSWR